LNKMDLLLRKYSVHVSMKRKYKRSLEEGTYILALVLVYLI
jgi:hypothetical protein